MHLVQLARDSGHGTASADGLLVLLAFGGLSLRIPINLAADRFGRSRAFGVICLAYSGALTAIAVAPRLLHVLQAASFVCGGMLGSLFSLLPTIVPGVVPPSRVVLATTAQMSFAGVGLFLNAGKVVFLAVTMKASHLKNGADMLFVGEPYVRFRP